MAQLLSLHFLVLVLRVTSQIHKTKLLLYLGADPIIIIVRLVCFLLFTLRYSPLLILERLIMS